MQGVPAGAPCISKLILVRKENINEKQTLTISSKFNEPIIKVPGVMEGNSKCTTTKGRKSCITWNSIA
jgi:hypothetical protein